MWEENAIFPHLDVQLGKKSRFFLVAFCALCKLLSNPVDFDRFNRVGFEAVRRFDPVL